MPRYVAFLRAINVGGRVVKMDHLKKLFEGMGLSNVRTFIASGNVIFESPASNTQALEKKIETTLEKALGYEVAVFVRSVDDVARIAKQQPYKDSDIKDGSVFVVLLQGPLGPREQKMVASLQTKVDDLRVNQREIYWLARKNFSGALFSPAKLEKTLASPATFRNVTTIRRLVALCAVPEAARKK